MMKSILKAFIFLIAGSILLCGCAPHRAKDRDFSAYFEERGVTGAFLLYDAGKDETIRFCGERCEVGFIPASTFKILNAQIALETGVIEDENEVIEWDGVDRGIDAWNKDHNLRTAMADSVVWFYQELARRIGEERMQHYVDLVGYGNQDITGKTDYFWLDGNLRISQSQQIELLRRLYEGRLPFSERTMETIKEILVLGETADYVLSGKTGWACSVNPDVGWFVGYLETNGNVFYFATNVDLEGSEVSLGKISQDITIAILGELGLMK